MDPEAFAAWHRNHPFARKPDDERELSEKVKARVRPFPRLPLQAYRLIFHFLRVYSKGMWFDLLEMDRLLADDSRSELRFYDCPQDVLWRLGELGSALHQHEQEAKRFERYRWAFALPLTFPHPQHSAVTTILQRAAGNLAFLRQKWEVLGRWDECHRQLQDAPLVELRPHFRATVSRFLQEVRDLRVLYHDDLLVTKMLSEVGVVIGKADVVEALGDPQLGDKQFRNIFWRLGLDYPGGEDYPRSITYRQAIALDLFQGNPVYLWEGRPAVDLTDGAGDGEGVDGSMSGDAAGGVSGQGNTQAAAAELQLAMRKAATIAADKISQGCEMCGTKWIEWSAVGKRENCEGIVVCKGCYPMWEEAPALHRLYDWFRVADLVDLQPGFVSSLEGLNWQGY